MMAFFFSGSNVTSFSFLPDCDSKSSKNGLSLLCYIHSFKGQDVSDIILKPSSTETAENSQGPRIPRKPGPAVHLRFRNGQEFIRSLKKANPLSPSQPVSLSLPQVHEVKRLALSNLCGRLFIQPDLPRKVYTVFQGDNFLPNPSLFHPPGKLFQNHRLVEGELSGAQPSQLHQMAPTTQYPAYIRTEASDIGSSPAGDFQGNQGGGKLFQT
jgi:hypothetical protein